jgi:general secretion pathway protein D
MKSLNWKKYVGGALAISLCAALDAQAQPRGGGGGGFGGGGFGGFGGGGGFRGGGGGGAGSAPANQYSPNGSPGYATFTVDPDTGNVLVVGDEEALRNVEQVLMSLDKPKPQVLIKVVFLEVQHNNALDIGIEGGWTKSLGAGLTNTIVNSFGLAGLNNSSNAMNTFGVPIQSFSQIAPYTGLPGAGLYQLLGSDFQATLRAIAQAGNAHLLSRPSVLARDRQPAEILVGQKVPLITGTTYTGVASIPVNNITYQNVGIQLNVTPFITGNLVEMIVQPSTSAIDSTLSIPISAGVNAPVIDIRSADTVVTTPDGQTVVIGGLMEADKAATVTKVPFLGDIPLLGHLFKRTITSSAKTELIIFLTPHIVQAPTQLAAMSEDERKNMLSHKADSDSERELDQFLDKRDANGYIRGTSKLPPGGVQSQRVTPP